MSEWHSNYVTNQGAVVQGLSAPQGLSALGSRNYAAVQGGNAWQVFVSVREDQEYRASLRRRAASERALKARPVHRERA